MYMYVVYVNIWVLYIILCSPVNPVVSCNIKMTWPDQKTVNNLCYYVIVKDPASGGYLYWCRQIDAQRI